jgi:hypothetical protein
VSLPARPVPGVSFVPMGFILHPQALRREGFGQLPCDDIGGLHALRRMQTAAAGQWLRLRRHWADGGMSSLEGVTPAGA